MTSPGEAAIVDAEAAIKAMREVSKADLFEYKALIQKIASNEKYAKLDERLSRFTSEGKLDHINRYLEEDIKKYTKQ